MTESANPNQKTGDTPQSLRNGYEKVARAARDAAEAVSERPGDKLREFAAGVSERASSASERVSDAAREAAEIARERGRDMARAGDEYVNALATRIENRPLESMAIALLAGAAAAWLLTRRTN